MTDQEKNPSTRDKKPKPTKPPIEEVGASNIQRILLYAGLGVILVGLGIGAGFLIWGLGGEPAPADVDAGADSEIPRCLVSADDDPSIGPESAPILMIEFADFNCGYCAKFHQETLEPLMATFPGQIRYVYRDFPIVGGFEAAQAAGCAEAQGGYWDYHDALFSGRLALDRDGFAQYADELGLDSEALLECFDSGSQVDEVIADARYAYALGAGGTPLFFINGIRIEGAQPLENFIAVIESELGKE